MKVHYDMGDEHLKVLFWDIDGTLMRTDKAGLFAFQQATRERYGAEADFSRITTAGRTDYYIAAQIIEQLTGRKPDTQAVSALVHHYVGLLPLHLSARKGHIIEPVLEILQKVSDRPGFAQLLLTGNVAQGARAKLSHFSVDHFFDFSASAFGDHQADRDHVAAAGWKAVRERYEGITPDNIFVIGDTPHDIRCGKSIGSRTVAVATGVFPLSELALHSPWRAVERLPAPEEFIGMLEN